MSSPMRERVMVSGSSPEWIIWITIGICSRSCGSLKLFETVNRQGQGWSAHLPVDSLRLRMFAPWIIVSSRVREVLEFPTPRVAFAK